MNLPSRFAGQVVLVAGGVNALGSAVSRALLQEGATVVATYRETNEYRGLSESVPAANHARLRGFQIDEIEEGPMQRAVEAVKVEFGRLDALINVGGAGSPSWEPDSSSLERMLCLNLRAVFAASKSVLPLLRKQGHGSIVNVAAQAGADLQAGRGVHIASNAAALALMHLLALEVRGTAARVNTVLQNDIESSGMRVEPCRAHVDLVAKADDVARVILFLCTPEARAIHRVAIPLN